MSAFGNPKIVDDGLVFMYDANNKKSFRGEPTTLYGSPFPSGSSLPSGFHWSYEYDNQVVDAPIQGHFLSKEKWVKSTRDTTGSRRVLFINNSFVTGKTYTFSCYAYSTDTNLTSLAHVSHNSGYSVRTDYTEYTNADLGKVKRIHGTWVQQVNGGPIFGMQTNNAALGTTFYMTGFQVEEKSRATQLTGGSRTNTNALIDRTKNTTIEFVNMSYNSNAHFTFDGTDDYIDLGVNLADIVGSNPAGISFVFVAKADDLTNPIGITGDYIGPAGTGFGIKRASSNNKLEFRCYGAGGRIPKSTTDIPTNSYFHGVCTWDSSGTLKIYYNGALETTDSGASSTWTYGNGDLRIGDIYGSMGVPGEWQGDIPIFKIYNRALTEAEVTQSFNAVRSRFGL